MNLLAVDLEATCDNTGVVPRREMEIIEIGAVMLSSEANVLGEFQTFIKPQVHPKLTDFCTSLTSIRQFDVDSAPDVASAFKAFTQWLIPFSPIMWCSWGDYDRKQFEADVSRFGLPWPIPGDHFNAKTAFSRQQRLKKKLGLKQGVEHVGLKWIGTHHRGIDDARNIAQLMPYFMDNQKL